MACRITEWVISSVQPRELAAFWAAALAYEVGETSSDVVELRPPVALGPAAPSLVLVRVPESKTIKNRLHLDVNATDRTRDEEVERLVGLGARRVDVGQGPLDKDGMDWVVLADPEGNEFCVLRSTVAAVG